MTNAERKAEWLAVAEYLSRFGYGVACTLISTEAERRSPTIRATKDFGGFRCVERDGKRILQFFGAASRWVDYCAMTIQWDNGQTGTIHFNDCDRVSTP